MKADKGLEGDELQAAICNAIGAAADNAARAAIGGLDDFQGIGEGNYEAIARVASGVETANCESRRALALQNKRAPH